MMQTTPTTISLFSNCYAMVPVCAQYLALPHCDVTLLPHPVLQKRTENGKYDIRNSIKYLSYICFHLLVIMLKYVSNVGYYVNSCSHCITLIRTMNNILFSSVFFGTFSSTSIQNQIHLWW